MPAGRLSDLVASWAGGRRRKNRFTNSIRALVGCRYVLALFGTFCPSPRRAIRLPHQACRLLAPYSAYGRIASFCYALPVGQQPAGLLRGAERIDSYAFYTTVDVWVKSGVTFAVAGKRRDVRRFWPCWRWRNGRTYCKVIGRFVRSAATGFVSRFAVFKPRIDTSSGAGRFAR